MEKIMKNNFFVLVFNLLKIQKNLKEICLDFRLKTFLGFKANFKGRFSHRTGGMILKTKDANHPTVLENWLFWP